VIITGDDFKCGNTFFTLRIESFNDTLRPSKENEIGDLK